jgi:hypothetical protein
MLNQADHDAICRALINQGKLIEAGFAALRFISIPADAPEIQIEEMRNAFFAGAQHLFATINSILDPGMEPTANDLNHMSMIQTELDEFILRYKTRWEPQ